MLTRHFVHQFAVRMNRVIDTISVRSDERFGPVPLAGKHIRELQKRDRACGHSLPRPSLEGSAPRPGTADGNK